MTNLQGDAGATEGPRTGDDLITAPAFEAVWPDVERRLRALLYRRGLDQASAEDVVQEVALRALAGRVTFTSASDLLRWAGPVARHLHVDLLRQRAWLEGEVAEDRPGADDVAGEVVDRLELQRALRGIAALRPADRAAIVEAVSDDQHAPSTRKEAVRLAVRRHRARSRLALVLEQLAGLVVGWRWLRQPRTAMSAALVVPAAAFPLLLSPATPPPAAPERAGPAVERPALRPPVRPVPVAPRLAAKPAPPAERVAAARPARVAGTAPKPVERPAERPADVDVEAPGDAGVQAGGDDRKPDDRTLCVKGTLGRICIL